MLRNGRKGAGWRAEEKDKGEKGLEEEGGEAWWKEKREDSGEEKRKVDRE